MNYWEFCQELFVNEGLYCSGLFDKGIFDG